MKTEEIQRLLAAVQAEHKAAQKEAENSRIIIKALLGQERMCEVEDVIILEFAKRWYEDCLKDMTNPREPIEDTLANMQAAIRVIMWHMPHQEYVEYRKQLQEIEQ